jgi:hypothetical protein
MKGTVNIHIAKIWFILAALIMLTLGSCRNDSDDRNLETRKVTLHPAIGRNVENVIRTRSVNVEEHWTDQDDVQHSISSTYPDLEVNGTSMRVYAVPADNTLSRNNYKAVGSFRYSNDTWHSSVGATINQEYYLYAISPINLPGATSQEFNWGENSNHEFSADNVVLTFTGLDIISASDPLVSIAAKGKHVIKESGDLKEVVIEKTDAEHPAVTQTLTEPTLIKGDYNIGTVYDDGETGEDSYQIWMAMDHLYAKATISFAIDLEYNNLRTIRVKEMHITTKYNGVAQPSHLDGTHSYKFKQGADFQAGGCLTLNGSQGFSATDVTPIDLMVDNYDPIDPDHPTAGHYDYATLKVPVSAEQYWEFGSFYFLPQASLPTGLTLPPIYLDVKYDVYSKEGTKVRADQHAINALSLNSVYRDDFTDHTPAAGDNVRIKVMVKPTYLYQLSDDDVRFELTIE